MTRREKRYLFIICVLLQKIEYILQDTNAYVEQLEQRANDQLKELVQKQVEADTRILSVWEENLKILLEENEQLKNKKDTVKMLRKERKRYGLNGE